LSPNCHEVTEPVRVAYRKDGSGTTQVLTEYLSKVSPAFSH
jgi:ABC-type phosphate transport system substrate-binding protein